MASKMLRPVAEGFFDSFRLFAGIVAAIAAVVVAFTTHTPYRSDDKPTAQLKHS